MDEKVPAVPTAVRPVIDAAQLDIFLPLPYRVLLLFNLGLWLWYLNLKVFATYRIDLPLVLKITHPDVTLRNLLLRAGKLYSRISIINLSNYFLYLFCVQAEISSAMLEYLPLIGLAFTLLAILYPSLVTHDPDPPESGRFRSTFRRISKGGIDVSKRTNDILLSDTITSYNKVIIDLLTYLSALLLGYKSLPLAGAELSKDHLQIYSIDILLSFYPSLVRLKQSYDEYKNAGKRNWIPLLNAVKYSTALLPILGSVLLRTGHVSSLRLWYWGSFINSTYSFIWDVSFDWNLDVFKGALSKSPSEGVLRDRIIFPAVYYYVSILIDLALRYIWVCRLFSPQSEDAGFFTWLLATLYTTESGRLLLELFELFRRWLWVFFRVEADYCALIAGSEYIPLRKV